MEPTGELSASPQRLDQTPGSSQSGVAVAAGMPTGHTEPMRLDERILPIVYSVTYCVCFLLVYAFMMYVIIESSTWRGPMILWALFIPTFVFSLWRCLPSEKRFLEAKSEKIVSLRCGGFYALAEPTPLSGGTG
ncbi:hypothetical protein JKF63_03623 [Porcisia hertigi]|uniref:Uncharacterized protein n=1 Tax=Porcisia hertigi TaxID=2761500 RepID=A0A836I035_9TRYP|nr:hypothetical protein JKF63_03623 [Porcisia hertigi]